MTKNKSIPTCKVNGCYSRVGLVGGICLKCQIKLARYFKTRKKPIKKQSDRGWPTAFKNAKAAFQKLRRLQDADENGVVLCVDGSYRKWNRCDAGHFIPANKIGTCFDYTNVHPQTKSDNRNMDDPTVSVKYIEFMLNKYGQEHINTLIYKSNQRVNYSVAELKILTDIWTDECNKIMTEKGLS